MKEILEWVILDIGGIVGLVLFFGVLLIFAFIALIIMWAVDSDRTTKVRWKIAGMFAITGLMIFVCYALFTGYEILEDNHESSGEVYTSTVVEIDVTGDPAIARMENSHTVPVYNDHVRIGDVLEYQRDDFKNSFTGKSRSHFEYVKVIKSE